MKNIWEKLPCDISSSEENDKARISFPSMKCTKAQIEDLQKNFLNEENCFKKANFGEKVIVYFCREPKAELKIGILFIVGLDTQTKE